MIRIKSNQAGHFKDTDVTWEPLEHIEKEVTWSFKSADLLEEDYREARIEARRPRRLLQESIQEMMVDLGDSKRGGETWSDSGSILKIRPTGFPVDW